MTSFLRRPWIAGLAVVATALAILLAFELRGPASSRIPAGVSRPAAPAPAKLLPGFEPANPDQAYPEIVARPLFTPTRRPAPPVASAAAPAFNRGQFQLLGVIIAGNGKTAMLKEKASGRIHRVEVGRELNGLKVASIDRESVTLALGAESETVPLQVQKGAPQAAHPAAAAGPFGGGAAPHTAPQPPGAAAPQPAPPPPRPTPQLSTGAAAFLGITPQGAPQQGSAPQQSAPMTPEELLARRRARRAQPNQ